jgi:hypothetical protein
MRRTIVLAIVSVTLATCGVGLGVSVADVAAASSNLHLSSTSRELVEPASWSSRKFPDPDHLTVINGISCVTSKSDNSGKPRHSKRSDNAHSHIDARHDALTSAVSCVAVGDSGETWDGPSKLVKTVGEVLRGSTWSVIPTPDPSNTKQDTLYSVSCSSDTECVAVGGGNYSSNSGRALVEQWDGVSWSIQTVPNPLNSTGSVLDGVSCVATGRCVAVGGFQTGGPNGPFKPMSEIWNGMTWSLVLPADPIAGKEGLVSLEQVSCVSSEWCMAEGGGENLAHPVNKPLIEFWNGKSWEIENQPSHTSSFEFNGIACITEKECMAVTFYSASASANTEVWDGRSWAVEEPNNLSFLSKPVFTGVSCVAAGSCIAVGEGYVVVGNKANEEFFADPWNGKSWTEVSVPMPRAKGDYSQEMGQIDCTSARNCNAAASFDRESGDMQLVFPVNLTYSS